jgi:hypothetical protein
MGRYVVRVWVPVEVEVEETYSSYEEACSVVESLSLMHPENICLVHDLAAEEEGVPHDEEYW